MNAQTKIEPATLASAMAAAFADIEGIRGYRVNALGEVWSDRAKRFLVGTKCGQMGYRAVDTFSQGRFYIHQAVCRAFHGPKPGPEYQVRHLDGDRNNNRADNLAWGTKAENEADKVRHGTTPKGERNPQAKLTERDVRAMRRLRNLTGRSYARIAAQFNVTTMTAYRAVNGECWK